MALCADQRLGGRRYLTVKVEDRAGNVKQSAPLTVTVDTHIAIDRIELVNDSGIPGDNPDQ